MSRVLVPVDGSEQSQAALKEAFELFPDGEIHVLHVTQVTEHSWEGEKTPFELAIEESEDILSEIQTVAANHDRSVQTEKKEGNAARTIIKYAEENDVDHIVMGSTGRSGISRILLGSVAESVTRRAPCSVTIVRD